MEEKHSPVRISKLVSKGMLGSARTRAGIGSFRQKALGECRGSG